MFHRADFIYKRNLFYNPFSCKPEIVVTCALARGLISRIAVFRSFDTVTRFAFRLSLQSDLSKNALANHRSAVRPLAANCIRARKIKTNAERMRERDERNKISARMR